MELTIEQYKGDPKYHVKASVEIADGSTLEDVKDYLIGLLISAGYSIEAVKELFND